MKILVVNPNTTASMTQKIGAAAMASATLGTEIVACNPGHGPESIEGYYDEAFSIPGLIGEIQNHPEADAIVLACFDDSGLDAARCIGPAPVVGIGEAAFHMASLISVRFGVVTTLNRSVPAIEHNLIRYGLAARCAKVRASEVPVLELEDPRSDARARISKEIRAAIELDKAEAIVLGCAGMADLAQSLSAEHGVPVLDGVSCAVKLAESLVALGLTTSSAGGYARPRPKLYKGMFAPYAPT
jgi:allantoin racemase